jgi:hypothetical protein
LGVLEKVTKVSEPSGELNREKQDGAYKDGENGEEKLKGP